MRGIVWIIIMIIALMLFLLSISLALMSILKLRSSVQAYFQKNIKQSYKDFLFATIFIIPLFGIVIFALNKFDFMETTQKIATVGLFISSFLGLYILLFFIYALRNRKIKESIISLIVGGILFLVFAPSAYFSISPIVKWKLHNNEIERKHLKFVEELRKEPQKVFEFITLETGKVLPKKSRVIEIENFEKSGYMNIKIETTESFVKAFPQFIIVYPKDNKNSYIHYYIELKKVYDRNNTLYLFCSY